MKTASHKIRKRVRNGRRVCAAAAVCSALALAALAYFGPTRRGGPKPAASRPASHRTAVWEHRAIYPYSVVPGGVFSRQEALRAAAKDRVVAAHYAGFDLRRARAIKLERDWVAHVSFRIRNAVYWTSRPLRLGRGELVLTDGGSYIRARCGNRIAEKRVSPTTAEEPPAAVLDTPEPPALPPEIAEIEVAWPADRPPAPEDAPASAAPPITDVNRDLFTLIPMFSSSWGGGGLALNASPGAPVMPPAGPPGGEPSTEPPVPIPLVVETDWVRPAPLVPPPPGPDTPLPPGAPSPMDVIRVVPPGDMTRIVPVTPGEGGTPGVDPIDNPRPPLPSAPPPPPPLPPSTPPEYIIEPRTYPPASPPSPADAPEPATLALVALALAVIAGRARRR